MYLTQNIKNIIADYVDMETYKNLLFNGIIKLDKENRQICTNIKLYELSIKMSRLLNKYNKKEIKRPIYELKDYNHDLIDNLIIEENEELIEILNNENNEKKIDELFKCKYYKELWYELLCDICSKKNRETEEFFRSIFYHPNTKYMKNIFRYTIGGWRSFVIGDIYDSDHEEIEVVDEEKLDRVMEEEKVLDKEYLLKNGKEYNYPYNWSGYIYSYHKHDTYDICETCLNEYMDENMKKYMIEVNKTLYSEKYGVNYGNELDWFRLKIRDWRHKYSICLNMENKYYNMIRMEYLEKYEKEVSKGYGLCFRNYNDFKIYIKYLEKYEPDKLVVS